MCKNGKRNIWLNVYYILYIEINEYKKTMRNLLKQTIGNSSN